MQIWNKTHSKGPTYVIGDLNARIQTRLKGEDEIVCKFAFDKHNTTLEKQGQETTENRQLLISKRKDNNWNLMNTYFDKPNRKLMTYREKGHMDNHSSE